MRASSIADVLAQRLRCATARAKGLAPRAVYFRHVLANALPALIVLFALSLPGLVAGSIFVESVFAWPGMGRLMVHGDRRRATIRWCMGATVLYAALVISRTSPPTSCCPSSTRDVTRSDGEPSWSRARADSRGRAAVLLGALVAVVALVARARRHGSAGDRRRAGASAGPAGSLPTRQASFHLLGTDRFGRDLLRAHDARGAHLARRRRRWARCSRARSGPSWARRRPGGAAGGSRRDGVSPDALLAIPRLFSCSCAPRCGDRALATVVVVLVATGWMGVARLVRAEVLGVRAQPYVIGRRRRSVRRHGVCCGVTSLPNALGPAIVATTLGVGNAILLESGLSFLGLGIQPPAPSWGNMIAGGRDLIVDGAVGGDRARSGADRDGAGVHAARRQSARSSGGRASARYCGACLSRT